MKEIVTVDGKQFELTTEYPLTEQQRQQTISDIRKSTGCSSCNKTQSLGGNIQTLAAVCVDVVVQTPAVVTVTGIQVGEAACTIGAGTCTPLVCSDAGCTGGLTKSVTATFTNTGDASITITPKLDLGPIGSITEYSANPITVLIPGNSTAATATFDSILLARGPNHICVRAE
jgi:hypothetical protein